MKHQRSESLRKLQRLQKGLPEEEEDLGQIFTIRKCPAAEAGECCHPCMHRVGLLPPLRHRIGLAASGPPCSSVASSVTFLFVFPAVGWCLFLINNVLWKSRLPWGGTRSCCTCSIQHSFASWGLWVVAQKHQILTHVLHFVLVSEIFMSV